jgi:prepilin-type N-terminal cleavage/methylation domain-containing protein
MVARDETSCAGMRRGIRVAGVRSAFTLVELMVTIVIIGILASLTLSGLAGVRQRGKADKTKSTIRKIDAVIRPMYDSYRFRRAPVALPVSGNRRLDAMQRLSWVRRQMMNEMPDQWDDFPAVGPPAIPAEYSAVLRSYQRYRDTLEKSSPGYAATFGSAECLYMIVSRSGFDPDAIELFRNDEIGDVDADRAKEFLDGWGRPIAFLRWAPRFSSTVQVLDPVAAHDPLDVLRVDPKAYALVPLIFSGGADASLVPLTAPGVDGYGFNTSPIVDLGQLYESPRGQVVGDSWRDNITNHDLIRK